MLTLTLAIALVVVLATLTVWGIVVHVQICRSLNKTFHILDVMKIDSDDVWDKITEELKALADARMKELQENDGKGGPS